MGWPNSQAETTAYVASASAASATTGRRPGGFSFRQVTPPSEVDHSAGSKAHPWRSSANRTSVTPDLNSKLTGAFRVASSCQVAPPSVVPATVAHMFWPQVVAQSIQPCYVEAKVTDWAW